MPFLFRCANCSMWVLFGGVTEASFRFCSPQCVSGFSTNPGAVEAQVQAMGHAEAGVRKRAATWLQHQTDPRATRALVSALSDANSEVRYFAVAALECQVADDRVRERLTGLLASDADARVRQKVAYCLVKVTDAATSQALVAALGDPNPTVRKAVALTMGVRRDTGAVPALIDGLGDGDAEVCDEVASSLAVLGDARAVEPLLAAIASRSSPVLRAKLTRSLAILGDRRAAPILLQGLESEEAPVRELAAASLGLLRHAEAAGPLLRRLTDSAPMVRSEACSALGRIGDRQAIEGLLGCLRDAAPEVRSAAAEALREIPDSRSVTPLRAAIRDEDLSVRLAVAEALARVDESGDAFHDVMSVVSEVHSLSQAQLGNEQADRLLDRVRPLLLDLKAQTARSKARLAAELSTPAFPVSDARQPEATRPAPGTPPAPPAPPAPAARQALAELGCRLIHTTVPKDLVLKRDTSHIGQTIDMIRRSIAETGRLDGTLHYTIDGYNSDPRELFEVPEVVRWARKLQDEYRHILLLLHEETALLHLILVCGVVPGSSPGLWVPEPGRCSAVVGEFEAAVSEFARSLGADTNEQMKYSIDVRKGAVLSSVARYGRKDATGTSGGGDGRRTLADFLNGLIPIFPVPESTMQSMEAITGSAAASESARLLFGPEGRWMMLGMGSMGPGGSPPVAIACLLRFARGSEDGPPRRDALRLLKRLFISVGRQHAFDLEQGGLTWPAELENLDPTQMELLTGDGTRADTSKLARPHHRAGPPQGDPVGSQGHPGLRGEGRMSAEAEVVLAGTAAPREALLEVSGLTVSYGAIEALKEATLRIERGEIVALIGANGAGKSTTLRAVSGMVQPRRGEVHFDGHLVADIPVHQMVRLGMSHVPEGRGIFANLSVEENLQLGGFTRTDQEIAEGIERGFELFPRLKERRTQNAGTLSGGEQQMLAIARGLISKPKLLLLDEPSLGLAPQIIENIFRIIVDINRQGMSILLVEQNAHQALNISHRGYVLETGRIVLSDSGKALLANEMVRQAYLGD